MKITIEQYGSSIIALSVFVLLLGLCMSILEKSNKYTSALGIFVDSAIAENTIGEKVQEKEHAFDIYRNQTLPEIFSYDGYEIRTGEYTAVSSCFYGKDRTGSYIPVKVNAILDDNEDKVHTVFQDGTECFYFEMPGTYRLILEAEDNNGKTQTAYVKIFVNGVLGQL